MSCISKSYTNLTGMLTSMSDGMTTPSASLMKAMAGWSKKSTWPTRTADPWAPAGILLNMASFLARLTSSLLVEYVSSFMSTTVSLFFSKLSPASPFFREPSNGKLTFLFSVSWRFCGSRREWMKALVGCNGEVARDVIGVSEEDFWSLLDARDTEESGESNFERGAIKQRRET